MDPIRTTLPAANSHRGIMDDDGIIDACVGTFKMSKLAVGGIWIGDDLYFCNE